MSSQDWYIYLIQTAHNTLYAGITTDVARRFHEHQHEPKKGARFLRGKGPLTLAWSAKAGNHSQALKAEIRLKKLPKTQKLALIQGRIDWRSLMIRWDLIVNDDQFGDTNSSKTD